MIARVWDGVTAARTAEAYGEYVRGTGVTALAATEGNQRRVPLPAHGRRPRAFPRPVALGLDGRDPQVRRPRPAEGALLPGGRAVPPGPGSPRRALRGGGVGQRGGGAPGRRAAADLRRRRLARSVRDGGARRRDGGPGRRAAHPRRPLHLGARPARHGLDGRDPHARWKGRPSRSRTRATSRCPRNRRRRRGRRPGAVSHRARAAGRPSWPGSAPRPSRPRCPAAITRRASRCTAPSGTPSTTPARSGLLKKAGS